MGDNIIKGLIVAMNGTLHKLAYMDPYILLARTNTIKNFCNKCDEYGAIRVTMKTMDEMNSDTIVLKDVCKDLREVCISHLKDCRMCLENQMFEEACFTMERLEDLIREEA